MEFIVIYFLSLFYTRCLSYIRGLKYHSCSYCSRFCFLFFYFSVLVNKEIFIPNWFDRFWDIFLGKTTRRKYSLDPSKDWKYFFFPNFFDQLPQAYRLLKNKIGWFRRIPIWLCNFMYFICYTHLQHYSEADFFCYYSIFLSLYLYLPDLGFRMEVNYTDLASIFSLFPILSHDVTQLLARHSLYNWTIQQTGDFRRSLRRIALTG